MTNPRWFAVLICLITSVCAPRFVNAGIIAFAAISPLEVARSLGEGKFAKWTYGNNSSLQQIDCTQFVVEVAQELLSQTFDSTWRNEINIANIPEMDALSGAEKKTKLAEMIANEDARIKGVQHAMISRGIGSVVNIEKITSGDFVQYWIKNENGWFGHAAIVEHVYEKNNSKRMKLYGAHQSINGVGSSHDKNDILIFQNDDSRKIFAVRLH